MPSSTSRCASAWQRSSRSSWNVTSPSHSSPSQRSELLDLLGGLGHLAAGVGVLDPQQELAALVAREEPVEERRAHVADVQEASRARCHADADGMDAIVGYVVQAVLIGGHCGGGIKGSIDRAVEIGADALQLFAQPNRAWRFPDHDPALLEAFREKREAAGIGAAFIHALYLLNLARREPGLLREEHDGAAPNGRDRNRDRRRGRLLPHRLAPGGRPGGITRPHRSRARAGARRAARIKRGC